MRIRRCITALAGAIALSVLAAMPSLAAGWQLDSTGYWYEREDRSYPADTWEKIGGTWYLFEQDGSRGRGSGTISAQTEPWYQIPP